MFRNPYADGLIVLVVLLLFFGPKRLPTLGRSLGQGLREFKDSITGNSSDDDDDRPEITKVSAAADVAAPESAPAPPAGPTATPADHAG
jgi:sec-independent protein translocase protein TatA